MRCNRDPGRIDLISKVHQRLSCGQSVLVQDGPYHRYPARAINRDSNSKWKVKWWRGNQVSEESTHIPGSYETVSSSRIVDALYGDIKGRRGVRLGKWTTVPEIREKEEEAYQSQYTIVENPSKSRPYTTKIHEILYPNKDQLTRLIFDRSDLNLDEFPTLRFLRHYHLTVVPYTGGLSLETQSEIMNWVYHNIPGVRGTLPAWITDGSLQHAFLLWIEGRDRVELENLPECPRSKLKREKFLREQAWMRLKQFASRSDRESRGPPEYVDIDLESLSQLEMDMFDRSTVAGHGGNCQWGLDVGIHQDNWWPYMVYPNNVDHGRDDEEETKPGRRYHWDPYTIKWREQKARQDEVKKKADDIPRPLPKRLRAT
ncbi:hypothetical protein PM082_019765 [Marasmius tenuissimus]|nr:hypothetical protein PM082_019765 [Marasmius tenuissimus]